MQIRLNKMVTRKPVQRRVALVLSPSQTFQREIIGGFGAYVREHGLDWAMSLDATVPADGLNALDGMLVDADQHDLRNLRLPAKLSVVCVGSALASPHPEQISLVCSGNEALISLALRHLRDTGVKVLAWYGKPKYRQMAWAQERLSAFRKMTQDVAQIRFECEADPLAERASLCDWVRSLPQRTGIVAINDSSARDLLQICNIVGRKVPDDLTIVGIDNDPLVDALAPMPISSVIQGTHEMGRRAAELLHGGMSGIRTEPVLAQTPPCGLELAKTSRHTRAGSVVRKALNFISEHAGEGIKVEQVADHVKLSRSALERCFEGQLGHSVHDEILSVRLARAKEMLMTRHATVAEIAVRCGFRTQQYMHVVFKRELGCTPTEFAARYQR